VHKASIEKPGIVFRIWRGVTAWSVESVPDELSRCAFDCKKTECLKGEWENCRARLDYAKKCKPGQPLVD
jgi:hypothetical protein